MHTAFAESGREAAIPIWLVTSETWAGIRAGLPAAAQAFAEAAGLEPKPGRYLALPSAKGEIAGVLFGLEKDKASANPMLPGSLPSLLTPGTYAFANAPHDLRLAT